MELTDISSYEHFLLVADTTKSLNSTMRSYVEFKEVFKVVEQCAKSDTEHITYEGQLIDKPIQRNEAQKALTAYQKRKWDMAFSTVSNCLNVQLR